VKRVPDVALAATLHDPRGALADDLRRFLPRLATLYRSVSVTTSPPTAARMNRLLAAADAYAGTPAANLRGPLYRLALRRAHASGAARIHYLDLDRTLHWLRRAPRELASALRAAQTHAILLLGRTRKAHHSHQRPLHATETIVNRLLADRLGVAGRVDFLVPSFVLDAAATARLLAGSRARDNAVYGEWAALLAGLGPEIAYLECRGLDWETPDQHRRQIRRLGLRRWRQRFETPEEWTRRTEMATAIVRGFAATLARAPVPTLAVRRLPARAR
jgi:hypothetical protein